MVKSRNAGFLSCVAILHKSGLGFTGVFLATYWKPGRLGTPHGVEGAVLNPAWVPRKDLAMAIQVVQ